MKQLELLSNKVNDAEPTDVQSNQVDRALALEDKDPLVVLAELCQANPELLKIVSSTTAPLTVFARKSKV